MSKLFEELRQHILVHCIRCGACATICPSIEIAQMNHLKPSDIQTHLLDFINDPHDNDIVSQRIDSCLECFKCVDSCPQGVNPLSCIEIAKTLSSQHEYEPYTKPSRDAYSSHEYSIQHDLTEHERTEVLRQSEYSQRHYVFFPGCNIYKNSVRLLKVKHLLHLMTEQIAFIPGIRFCCGDSDMFDGRFHDAEEKYQALTEEIDQYHPEAVILWCPTCLARMKKTWKSPLKFVSFFQFCQEHMHTLRFTEPVSEHTVTLHEPCKTAYTGLDQSYRDVIKAIPGFTLTDMTSGITCCGSGGISYYKDETVNLITRPRLDDATETGAEMLITICHYCQELFEHEKSDEHVNIVNLADVMYEKLTCHDHNA